jgi:formamidase
MPSTENRRERTVIRFLLPLRSSTTLAKTLISVDPKKVPWEQETPLQNQWHPDMLPVASVKEGDFFPIECVDWTGGQIKSDDSSEDIKNVDLSQVHYLSGPVAVEGAEPGDLSNK